MRNTVTHRLSLTVAAVLFASALLDATQAERRGMHEVTLPTGTVLPLTLDTAVASDTSRIEDAVRAHLRRPLIVDGRQILPAGTRVSGIVTEADRSARVKGRARLAFRFTSLSHDGERYGLETSRVIREATGTKKKDATTIAVPAGAGALIGALVDGKKGAAIGSAVGGAAGTGVVLSTRGREVRVSRGAPVGVTLLRPLRILVPRGRD